MSSAEEQFRAQLLKEEHPEYATTVANLSKTHNETRSNHFSDLMEICDRYASRDSEMLYTAMNLFDRSHSLHGYSATAAAFALASLAISAKAHGCAALGIGTLSAFSLGSVSKGELASTEMKLLRKLNWRVHPPTAKSFSTLLLRLLDPLNTSLSKRDRSQIHYLLDLACADAAFLKYRASYVALACIIVGVPNSKEGILARLQDLRESWSYCEIALSHCCMEVELIGDDLDVEVPSVLELPSKSSTTRLSPDSVLLAEESITGPYGQLEPGALFGP